ncbi:hypothetical protein [Alteromonas macleodii]|uniref:hypothetical protein n=1 Tax=Alteromonas macleodii TaxID=28108 RepID=UPI000A4528DE|nr:hypothetical protein [Alteromonas macleodii]
MVHVRLMSTIANLNAECWLVESPKASFTNELNQQALRVDRHLPRWQSSIVLRV